MGYKSFLTYNMNLYYSHISHGTYKTVLYMRYRLYMCYRFIYVFITNLPLMINPLTYHFINSSPFYPGPCVPGGRLFLWHGRLAWSTVSLAWSTVSLCKTWYSRIQEIVQAKWKNLSLGKIISVTQAMSYCKTLFISYLLVRYVRRVHLGQTLVPSRDFGPPVISNPYILLINV